MNDIVIWWRRYTYQAADHGLVDLLSFDHAIAERAQSHLDFALFEALPGAGAVLAPRLLVAFGEQQA